jgi:hypothetical protein
MKALTAKESSSKNKMESFISERISAIPEVEEVILSSEDKSIDIWIIVNKLDRDVRKKFMMLETRFLRF